MFKFCDTTSPIFQKKMFLQIKKYIITVRTSMVFDYSVVDETTKIRTLLIQIQLLNERTFTEMFAAQQFYRR